MLCPLLQPFSIICARGLKTASRPRTSPPTMPASTWACSPAMASRPGALISRFLTVGLGCALLHNAVIIGGDRLGLHYVASSFVSFAIVVVFGYWLHREWTFSDAERGGARFWRYAVAAAANLPLSIAGMFVFVDL